MAILKITCPHCNFSYVLPENKVPSGELTVTCQNCQQTYTYTKPGPDVNLRGPAGRGLLPEPFITTRSDKKTPGVENRPFYRKSSAPEPADLRDEPEKYQGSSTESIPTISGVENRLPTGWEPASRPEQVQSSPEDIPEAPAVEDTRPFGWEPTGLSESVPVQTSAENVSEAPAEENTRPIGWEPTGLSESVPVQTSTEKIPEAKAREATRSFGWQPVSPPEEPKPIQTPTKVFQETPAVESSFLRSESENREKPKQVQASAESIPKAAAAELKPSPVPKPVAKPAKKAIRKPVVARRGSMKKWIIAVAALCAIAIVVSIAVYKPVAITRVKEMYGIWSVKIKEDVSDVSSFVNEKLEPKPVVTEPSQPPIDIPREAAIVRPTNFGEIAGTWTGQLRNDRKGPKWTFSFNPANYAVSIKNNSGLWIKGTAVYHWDQGSVGDSLRVKPYWNVLDIDIIESSVSEDAGKASLGAFSRRGSNLKLCLSRPGKMIEPTETDATGDIQCFELKK